MSTNKIKHYKQLRPYYGPYYGTPAISNYLCKIKGKIIMQLVSPTHSQISNVTY